MQFRTFSSKNLVASSATDNGDKLLFSCSFDFFCCGTLAFPLASNEMLALVVPAVELTDMGDDSWDWDGERSGKEEQGLLNCRVLLRGESGGRLLLAALSVLLGIRDLGGIGGRFRKLELITMSLLLIFFTLSGCNESRSHGYTFKKRLTLRVTKFHFLFALCSNHFLVFSSQKLLEVQSGWKDQLVFSVSHSKSKLFWNK